MSGLAKFGWLIGDGAVLALLLLERANIYRDELRTKAARREVAASPNDARHSEGQKRLHPEAAESVEGQAFVNCGDGLTQQHARQR